MPFSFVRPLYAFMGGTSNTIIASHMHETEISTLKGCIEIGAPANLFEIILKKGC